MEFLSFVIDWTVIVGVKNVGLYLDDQATQPFTGPIHHGEIPQGQSRSFTVFAKNEGEIPTDVHFETTAPPPTGVTVDFSPADIVGLPVGQVQPVDITVDVAIDAVMANGSVTVRITDGA